MKKIYSNLLKRLFVFKKRSRKLFTAFIKNLKRDIDFYNKSTELLAIWTVLFMIITGLFVVALKSKISVTLLLLILSFIITLITAYFTTYYLYAIKYHRKKQLLPRAHMILNKSFKLRSLLIYIKIPYKFKHLIKLNFKFAS